MYNTIYYIARSYNSGKKINILLREVEALAQQHGNHFGSDTSSGNPVYSPFLQFYLTPLYNTLLYFEGEKDTTEGDEKDVFPWGQLKIVDNDDIMKAALNSSQLSSFHTSLSYQTAQAFISRDMSKALKLTDLYFEHFVVSIAFHHWSSLPFLLFLIPILLQTEKLPTKTVVH